MLISIQNNAPKQIKNIICTAQTVNQHDIWHSTGISSRAINVYKKNIIPYILISTWHNVNIIDLN